MTTVKKARQAVLDLPASPPRMTRESFVVSASNEAAMKTVEAWKASRETLLVICGPKGSGKTHIARMLIDELSEIGAAATLIDDIDRLASKACVLSSAEEARASAKRLILAGRGEPKEWAAGLKDLETRINAAPRVTLVEPDEALLRAVMSKVFRDKQLRASETIADYAAPRLAKTFAAAQGFVAALDALSIETGRPIGLKLAREVFDNLSEEAFEA